MNRRSSLTMRDVSLHRSVIYGFSALWIVFHHMISKVPSGAIFEPFRWLKFNGAAGVDIFVILSALGAYHSLERNPDVRGFYRRRFLRVVPCAFIISVIAYGLAGWVDPKEFLGAITFFPYWIGFDALWYVPFILTLYLIYPLFYRLQKKCPAALWAILAVTTVLSAYCCYILTPNDGHWLPPIMRLPLFTLGCILAPWADRGGRIPRWTAPASLALYILIAYVYPRGIANSFPRSVSYIFLAVFLIIALTWLARLFTRCAPGRFLYRCLALCGGVSLEIYLIYSRLLYFMEKYPDYRSGRIGSLKLEAVTILLTLILSLLLNRFCIWLTAEFTKIPASSGD